MLEENSNPNTNKQVPEVQCSSAEQPLAQQKRPQSSDRQSAFIPLADSKLRRQATLAKHGQKVTKVNVHKAFRVNILAAVEELVKQDSENRTSRSQVGMTELLVFLMKHVRLDDGTRFKVDPANNYEITKVRGPIHFCCTVALNCSEFQTKSGRRELGKIRYDSSDKSSTFFQL